MASESDEDVMEVPTPTHIPYDAICSVCNEGGEAGLGHSFAQCAACKVIVHRDCYGHPLTRLHPERAWTCDSCIWKDEAKQCVLCPDRSGLMKRTTDWRWAHLSCSLWIPETFFRDGEGRAPVDYFQVNGKRFKQTCCYCGELEGACVECTEPNCNRFFHITCGMKNNVYLEYKESAGVGTDVVITLCHSHGRKWLNRKDARCIIRTVK